MDSFIKIVLRNPQDFDVVYGLLSELPFSGFEEGESEIYGYMPHREWNVSTEEQVKQLVGRLVSEIKVEIIPFENWNQKWEENYPEVVIDRFCRIYAPFHGGPTRKVPYEILISPQMAFGTGHHNTTQMMIRLMSHIPDKIHDKSGLDFGAGSGILAILASKMGASHIDAVEIDAYAYQNLKENIRLNGVDWVSTYEGGMDQLPSDARYDFILANVTRGIIMRYVGEFYERLNPDGRILVSGILSTDHDEIHRTYIKYGFFGLESMKIGNWTALLFGKKSRKSTL